MSVVQSREVVRIPEVSKNHLVLFDLSVLWRLSVSWRSVKRGSTVALFRDLCILKTVLNE